MDMSDLLTLVLTLFGVLALLGVALIGFVMWRYRIPPRGLLAMIGALVYLASPIDVLPENGGDAARIAWAQHRRTAVACRGPSQALPAQLPPLRSSCTSS